MNNPREIWNTIKRISQGEKSVVPNSIIHEGKLIESPKKLAETLNQFFNEKIRKIRKEIPETNQDPMELVRKLIPKKESRFKMKEINVQRTYEIIENMKSSNTCGFDNISSRTIKMIPELTAILMTHAINCMIRKKRFPDILKISRILPISKPGRDNRLIENMRPISNLNTLEKVVEEHVKTELLEYLDENEILLKNHHGGRSGHSTLSAKSVLDFNGEKALDEDNLAVLVSTNLSSVFDLVDH